MRSPNSVFSKKYFVYALMRILPYAGAMAAIVAAFNILFFAIPRSLSTTQGLNADVLSGCAPYLMVIIPMLLSIGLFNFLYKRKKSDFFGSAPLGRTALFLTNLAVGAVLIFCILLVNLVSMILIVTLIYPAAVAVFEAYMWSFFAMLAGWLAVFGACCLCASVSGNVISHIALSGVLLFVPAFLFAILQGWPQASLAYGSAEPTATALNGLSSHTILFLPSFYSGAISDLASFLSIQTSMPFVEEPTRLAYTELWRLLYNFGLFAVFSAIGCVLMQKRPMETAERPYVKEIITDIVLFAAFLPVIIISCVMISPAPTSGIISLCACAIFFFIAIIILRRGFRRFWRGAIAFGASAALAALLAFVTPANPDLIKLDNVPFETVKKASVYVQPLDAIGQRPLEIDVPVDLIKSAVALSGQEGQKTPMQLSLHTDNGKAYQTYILCSPEAWSELYAYIDKNDECKKLLEAYSSLPSVQTNLCSTVGVFELPNIIEDAAASALEARRSLSAEERFAISQKTEDCLQNGYRQSYADYLYEFNERVDSSVISYHYINGSYYYISYVLNDIITDSTSAEAFENLCEKNIPKSRGTTTPKLLMLENPYAVGFGRAAIFEAMVRKTVENSEFVKNPILKSDERFGDFENLALIKTADAQTESKQYVLVDIDLIMSEAAENFPDSGARFSAELSSLSVSQSLPVEYIYPMYNGYIHTSIQSSAIAKIISETPDAVVSVNSSEGVLSEGVCMISLYNKNYFIRLTSDVMEKIEGEKY